MARIFLMTLLLASSLILPLAGRCDVIRYPHAESDSDSRQDYPLQLLKLALSKAGGNHTLAPSKVRMQQGRAARELELPDSLRQRIAHFRETGKVFRAPNELFAENSWVQVMLGQGILSAHHHQIAVT